MLQEIAARLREELDYELEARHMALYAHIFADEPRIRVPDVAHDLTTKRLLSMTWLDGAPADELQAAPNWKTVMPSRAPCSGPGGSRFLALRCHSRAIRTSETTRCSRRRAIQPGSICSTMAVSWTFPDTLRAGRHRSLQRPPARRPATSSCTAYETWGFKGLTNELIEAMNIWAQFIYGPLLDDS